MKNKKTENLINKIYIVERKNNINNCINRINKSYKRQQRMLNEYSGKHCVREKKICNKLVKLIMAFVSAFLVGYAIGTIIIENID